MNFRATGHAAAIAAAGLWICTAGVPGLSSATAQTQDPTAAVGSATAVTAAPDKPIRLHSRKTAAKSHKATRHTAKAKPKDESDTAKADTANTQDAKPDATKADQAGNAMSPAVANANAQWPADTPAANTYNVSAKAGTVLSQMGAQPEQPATVAPEDGTGNGQVTSSDQLNDLDRAAAADDGKPPLTLARATIDTPPAPAQTETASSETNSPWTQTSMIGKVFIALGGVLTLASAARMFMA